MYRIPLSKRNTLPSYLEKKIGQKFNTVLTASSREWLQTYKELLNELESLVE
jgi:hypothetical protein